MREDSVGKFHIGDMRQLYLFAYFFSIAKRFLQVNGAPARRGFAVAAAYDRHITRRRGSRSGSS